MATHNVTDGTGGLDGSIKFETDRAEVRELCLCGGGRGGTGGRGLLLLRVELLLRGRELLLPRRELGLLCVELLLALLDWLLAGLFEVWDISASLSPGERLLEWLKLDLQDLSQDDQGHVRLFFSYWMLAAHDATIDERMKDALERSRQALLPIVQAVIEGEPARFHQVAPEELVTVMLAITQGIAMQSLLTRRPIDVGQILSALRALLLPAHTD